MTHKNYGEIQIEFKTVLYRVKTLFITRIQKKGTIIPGIRMNWKSMLIFIFVVTKLLKQRNDS